MVSSVQPRNSNTTVVAAGGWAIDESQDYLAPRQCPGACGRWASADALAARSPNSSDLIDQIMRRGTLGLAV
jgi:hypothetical protein